MQIGITDSGKIGATAGRLLAGAGHDVAIANSRGPETLTDLVGDLGERARPVDATNYFPNRDGHLPELDRDATTSTELVATHLPDARVVKAFNTMQWIVLRGRSSQGPMDERLVLFVAGDDEEAEAIRRQQPGSSIFVKELKLTEARDLLGRTG